VTQFLIATTAPHINPNKTIRVVQICQIERQISPSTKKQNRKI
jgi:hypothetical protein